MESIRKKDDWLEGLALYRRERVAGDVNEYIRGEGRKLGFMSDNLFSSLM